MSESQNTTHNPASIRVTVGCCAQCAGTGIDQIQYDPKSCARLVDATGATVLALGGPPHLLPCAACKGTGGWVMGLPR